MKTPLFCPNPRCPYHNDDSRPKNWFIRKGFYSTGDGSRVQRYQCSHCRRRFSSKTFSIDYFAKTFLEYRRLLTYLSSGMSLRALGRVFGHSPKTIAGKISRLARQIIAFNQRVHRLIALTEDLVADGFESFVVSHYFPNNINLLVGKDSQFVYDLTYAQLRRKGAMTTEQKAKARVYRMEFPLPAAQIPVSFTHLMRSTMALFRQSAEKDHLTVYTDEKKEYRAPLAGYVTAGLPASQGKVVSHHQTPSSAPRTLQLPTFSANYIDREVRKDMAEHHRESVCFARNVVASLERLVCYLFHHNYFKPFRINRRDREYATHAEAAGIAAATIRKLMYQLFTRRAFFTRQNLQLPGELLWRRAYPTPKKFFCNPLPAFILAG